MYTNPSVKDINMLFQKHGIHEQIVEANQLSGTTEGRVFRLRASSGEQYILKWDDSEQIRIARQFLETYSDVRLLPSLLFTGSDSTYFVYSYMQGETHYNRGSKKVWLTRLVKELFNTYVRVADTASWGRMELPRRTWREFNQISIEEARENLGDVLGTEDYNLVQILVNRLFQKDEDARFLLHGDTGVLYAFCSSPDDLDPAMLWEVFEQLEHADMHQSRLMKEAMVHLYCRIGLSNKHHPQDLPEYLRAWNEWRQHIMHTAAAD